METKQAGGKSNELHEDMYQMHNDEEIDLQQIEEEYQVMIDDLKQESQNIYILLRSMAFTNDSFRENMKKAKKEMKNSMNKKEVDILYRTNIYFKLNTGRIEIINESN